ncbi:UDP-3-O-(3-hydroxymyristoyl)glucosamine N-acyltransferase [Rickettsiella endosymbiont of Aleochara curtula]|uniref:UDP-3-O-(3-hydroxymyristoyl)glucosamine N-acyltransferase n=1 Tax=Rickettsiella endosymbiont of Aleochara curtula TaxID=3077936 RepID=UPI00313E37E9
MQRRHTLQEIARLIGADLKGDPNCLISGIMALQSAKAGQISFLDNKRYLKYLAATQASAVILNAESLKHAPNNALVVADPYLAFAKVAKLFERLPQVIREIHTTAVIAKDCHIHPSVSIAPYVVIGANTRLDEGVVIGAACVIGENVVIGANTRLASHVSVCADTQIGERVIIHNGSVIGSDGFGLAKENNKWVKIPQLGKVQIGHDVEIGANVSIDRGALGDTIIGDGVKLDNQIQVGHNVTIGENTAIAGCTGIAGSTHIGKNCMIGGGVCINGHIEIVDNVYITGMSSVVHSIRHPGIYSSTHTTQPVREWQKNSVRFRQLDQLAKRLRKTEALVNNISIDND